MLVMIKSPGGIIIFALTLQTYLRFIPSDDQACSAKIDKNRGRLFFRPLSIVVATG